MTSHYEKFSLFLVTHLQMKKCPSKRSQLSVFYPSEKCSLLQFIYKQHLLKDKSRTHGYVFLGGKKEAVNKRATVLATRTFQKFAYVETSCRHAVICQKHAASIERFWFFYFFSDPVNLATQTPTSIFILGGKGFSADAHITTTLAAFIHNNIKMLL